MSKKPDPPAEAADLRRRAEARFKARKPSPQKDADPQRLRHELEVHQIELELQNDELRQAHTKLEAALDQYTELYDFAPVGYLTVQPDGTITQANLTATTLLGVERSRLLQRRFALFIATEDRSAFAALLTRAFASKAPETAEARIALEGKPPLRVNLRAWVVAEENGCRLVLTDITERERAAAALQTSLTSQTQAEQEIRRLNESLEQRIRERTAELARSEERFRIAAQTANDVVYEWDLKEIVLWFGKIDEMLGYGPGEFPRTLAAWAAAVHPEDMERTWAAVQAHLEGRAAYVMEYRVRRKDGVYRWWVARGAASRTPEGKPLRMIGSITDITELRQADLALRESESRFRQLANSLPQLVWTCLPDGPCDFLSQQWVEYTGIAETAQLGFGWLDQLHPDDRAPTVAGWNAAVASGEDFQVEFRVRRHDGEYRWFDTRAVRLRDTTGRTVKWFGSNTDITERKQAELTTSRLAAIVESSEDCIVGKDLQGIVNSWNQGAERIFGYSASEMIGSSILRLVPADRQNEEKQILEQIQRGERVNHFETLRQTKDGRLIDVSITASPIRDARGQIVGVSKVARDISGRKRAEAQVHATNQLLQAIIDQSQCLIYAKDLEGRLILVSQPLAQLFGRSSPEEVLGQTSHAFLPQAAADQHRANDLKVMQCRALLESEETVLTPNGQLTFLSRKFPLLDAENQMYAVCGISWEITARKQAELALRESEAKFQTIIEASPVAMALNDAHGNITYLNRQFLATIGYPLAEIPTVAAWWPRAYPDPAYRQRVAQEWQAATEKAYREGTAVQVHDCKVACKDGSVRIINFSVASIGTSHVVILHDLTERKRVQAILEARVGLSEYALNHSLEELLTRTLDACEELTGSQIGFFHFVEADQNTLSLQMWSTNTLQKMCKAEGQGRHYPVDQAGVWVDALRERRPMIHNDYANLPHRRGLPPGHAPVVRQLVVPIMREDKIVALLGVGNKPTDYQPPDVESATQLANLTWDIVVAKQAEEASRASLEEKTTLLKEVHHRVKNNLQLVASLLNLQAGRVQNPEVLDLLAVTRNRVSSMALLHEHLYQRENFAHLDLAQYVDSLCSHLLRAAGPANARVRIEQHIAREKMSLGLDQAVPLGLLLNELVTNALKHAFPGERAGLIRVTLAFPTPQELLLTVADDGIGLPATLDPRQTRSLGLKLVFLLTQQLDGTVNFERAPGTAVQIRFPNPAKTETPS